MNSHRMLHVNEQEKTLVWVEARFNKTPKNAGSRAPSPPRAVPCPVASSGEYLPNPERRAKIAPLAVEL